MKNIVSAIIPVFLAAAMTGCGMIKPKTDATATLMATKAVTTEPWRCDTTYLMGGKEEMPYVERLRHALNLFTPHHLQVLQDNNVKVCLDQRHALTDSFFFAPYTTLYNTFYPATKDRSAVIGLYDDGGKPWDFYYLHFLDIDPHYRFKFMEMITKRLETGNAPKTPVHFHWWEVCTYNDSYPPIKGRQCCGREELSPIDSSEPAQKDPNLMNPPLVRSVAP